MTEYIKKHYRLILMSVFAALVCFGYQAFNSNIRIDTEELINHPGSTLGWLTIGRFGLVLLKRMLGLGVIASAVIGHVEVVAVGALLIVNLALLDLCRSL